MKTLCYETPDNTEEELERRIESEGDHILRLPRAISRRALASVELHGGHFEQIL